MKSEKSFSDKVREVVRKIPKGEVRSYKEVAKLAGSPLAYRAVATVMSHNFDKTIPCHRVIKNDGTPGGYNGGGPSIKRMKLLEEGWNGVGRRSKTLPDISKTK